MTKTTINILPEATGVRLTHIPFETFQYMEKGGEIVDVSQKRSQQVHVPELNYHDWLQLCIDLKEQGVNYEHYYMNEVIPYNPEKPHHNWSYFATIEDNRFIHKNGSLYVAEMLLYFIPELQYYVLINLESHRGQLKQVQSAA